MNQMRTPRRASIPQNLTTLFENCNKCSLSEKSYPVWPRGNWNAKAILMLEAPGKTEEEENLYLVGRAGKEMDKAFLKLNVDMDKHFFIMNTVGCRPWADPSEGKENRAPRPDEITACRPRVTEIIVQHNPSLIVLAGATPMKGVFKKPPRSISEVVGHIFPSSVHIFSEINAEIIVIWHPSFLLHNPANISKWMQQLVRVRDYMLGNGLLKEGIL